MCVSRSVASAAMGDIGRVGSLHPRPDRAVWSRLRSMVCGLWSVVCEVWSPLAGRAGVRVRPGVCTVSVAAGRIAADSGRGEAVSADMADDGCLQQITAVLLGGGAETHNRPCANGYTERIK